MLIFSSPHPAMAYADPTSIFDHWKWNEIHARRNLGEANKDVKEGEVPVFLSTEFWKCLLNGYDGFDQRLA